MESTERFREGSLDRRPIRGEFNLNEFILEASREVTPPLPVEFDEAAVALPVEKPPSGPSCCCSKKISSFSSKLSTCNK